MSLRALAALGLLLAACSPEGDKVQAPDQGFAAGVAACNEAGPDGGAVKRLASARRWPGWTERDREPYLEQLEREASGQNIRERIVEITGWKSGDALIIYQRVQTTPGTDQLTGACVAHLPNGNQLAAFRTVQEANRGRRYSAFLDRHGPFWSWEPLAEDRGRRSFIVATDPRTIDARFQPSGPDDTAQLLLSPPDPDRVASNDQWPTVTIAPERLDRALDRPGTVAYVVASRD